MKTKCQVLVAVLVLGCFMLSSSLVSSSAYQSGSTPSRRFVPQHIVHRTLTSPNAQYDGWFGTAVAASGNTLVVSAYLETVGSYSDAGRAYIFNAKTGSVVSNLTSANPQTGGEFGNAVAVSGDIVVVGAGSETVNGMTGAGRAYVFNATNGALIQTLSSPNAQTSGYFGWVVATNGKTVIVTAYDETVNSVAGAGRVYIFGATSGKLLKTLTSPNSQYEGYFGCCGASATSKQVVVGAFNETSNGYVGAGHAYVFNAKSGKLIYSLNSPNAQTNGEFGSAVAQAGKIIAIGAQYETANGLTQAGHAYTFNASTGSVINTLTSPNAQTNGEFGWSVGVSGNAVLISAWLETASGYTDAGHAYKFAATTGMLLKTYTSPNAQNYGYFGYFVAISGKIVLVGAPDETAGSFQYAGHAYIF